MLSDIAHPLISPSTMEKQDLVAQTVGADG